MNQVLKSIAAWKIGKESLMPDIVAKMALFGANQHMTHTR
jgi:hypothetical protein